VGDELLDHGSDASCEVTEVFIFVRRELVLVGGDLELAPDLAAGAFGDE